MKKSEETVRKTILACLILSQITFMLSNFFNIKQHENKIVNKSILTEGMYEDFLFKFFKNKLTKHYMTKFIETYVTYIKTSVGKSFDHVCKRTNFLWYYRSCNRSKKSTVKQKEETTSSSDEEKAKNKVVCKKPKVKQKQEKNN